MRYHHLSLLLPSLLSICSIAIADDNNTAPAPLTPKTNQSAPASIISLKNAMVSAEIAANIKHVTADVGDIVKKGSTLVSLDCREYDALYEQAQANIATANAQLLSAKSLLETHRSDIEASNANVTLAQAQLSAEKSRIATAMANYASAKSRTNSDTAKCKLATIELQRSRGLREKLLIPQQDLDRALASYQASQAECSAVQSSLAGAQSSITTSKANANAAKSVVNVQQAKVRASKSNLEVAKTDISAKQANLDATKAMLKTEALMVSRCQIKAPFSGQIVQRMVQEGQRIAAGGQAFQLLSTQDAEVTASLSSEEIDQIKTSNAAYFTSNNKKVELSLRSVVAIVTGQARTQEVRFSFKKQNTLPIGLNGRVVW